VSRETPPQRTEFAVWQRVSTRWADNDAYGHVNNTVYYQWFDTAVNSWLVDQQLLDIGSGDPIALVVETRCAFFAPLSFPGEVEVGLRVRHVGTSSVRYQIGIFDSGANEPAAAGEFVHVAVSRAARRPVPWPDEWRRAFASIA
jgi:acyl-CoA thioester hydrolase